jgi:transposase-like protein
VVNTLPKNEKKSASTPEPSVRRQHDSQQQKRVLWSKPASCASGACGCKAVVSSLEEAGEELSTFLQFPKSQWKALRATNALERINEEFRRRTKTQASLPSEDAVLLLLFGLLRSGQIVLRRMDGWQDIAKVIVKSRAA